MSNASLMSWHDGGYNSKAATDLSHLRRKTVISQNSVIGKWLQSNDDADELSRRSVATAPPRYTNTKTKTTASSSITSSSSSSSYSNSSTTSLGRRAANRISITAHLDYPDVGRRMEPFSQTPDVMESDYANRNELYKAIEEKRFSSAISIATRNPDLARAWIVRKNSDKEVVLRRLPLHLACIFRSPHELIRALIKAYDKAAQLQDQWMNLPIHYMCEKGCDRGETMLLLLKAYPDCLNRKGMRNMVPLSMVRKGSPPDREMMLQQFHEFLLFDFSSQLEKDIANANGGGGGRNGCGDSSSSSSSSRRNLAMEQQRCSSRSILSTHGPSTRGLAAMPQQRSSSRSIISTHGPSTRGLVRDDSVRTAVETRGNQGAATNICFGPSIRFDEGDTILESDAVSPAPDDEDAIDSHPDDNYCERRKITSEPSLRLTPPDDSNPGNDDNHPFTLSHGPSVRFATDETPIHPPSPNDNPPPETAPPSPPPPHSITPSHNDDDISGILSSSSASSEKVNRALEDRLTDLEAQLENSLSENAVMKDVIKMLMDKIKRADRIINDKNNHLTSSNNNASSSLTKRKSLRDSFSRSDLSGRLGRIIIDNSDHGSSSISKQPNNLRDSFRRMENGGKRGLNASQDFDDGSSVGTNPASVATTKADVQNFYGGMRGRLDTNKHYCDAAISSKTASIY